MSIGGPRASDTVKRLAMLIRGLLERAPCLRVVEEEGEAYWQWVRMKGWDSDTQKSEKHVVCDGQNYLRHLGGWRYVACSPTATRTDFSERWGVRRRGGP